MELIFIFIAVAIGLSISLINHYYRRCPSDRILVIYGSSESNKSIKCIHSGGAFVWPIIEDYAYLSLTPIGIDVNLTNAASRQNIRVDVPCRFTVGISTEPDAMHKAAERLLGLSATQIQELARDIMFGQLRLVISTMSIEEMISDREKFAATVEYYVENKIKDLGLTLINLNVLNICDDNGYIEAIERANAAQVIYEANARIAEYETKTMALQQTK